MKRNSMAATVLCLLGIILASCAAPAAQSDVVTAPEMAAGQPAPKPAIAPDVATERELANASYGQATERMIVQTVDLQLIVTDSGVAADSIRTLAESLKGYVTSSSQWRDGEQLRARMTVRIPAASLDDALTQIKSMAVRVEQENISGQDVTEEFSDLDAQLVNLEATEKELRELLAEVRQRTQKAEDILQVHQQLTNIRGEIERVKGRMNYLSNQTSLATLNVELVPDALARPVVEPGWRPQETLRNAARALLGAMRGVGNAAIWFVVYALPLLIVIAIPFVLLALAVRWLIRRRQAGRLPKPAVSAETDQQG